ncbi:MAG: DUF3568 family protein [Candidatus Omnitrophica bacterium]|nr:DUF3568 family protein [Candidatus Omnitrophota bacterium]
MARKILCSLFILLTLSGCAALLIGTGVLGGVAISEDTVRSEVDTEYDRAWATTLNELEKMGGEFTVKDKVRGVIEVKVRASNIHIEVDRLTPKTIRLTVKSRKRLLPNIKLAHEISARVLRQL